MTGTYGAISFSTALAAQEPDIKVAALADLHQYLNESHMGLAREEFWSCVARFDREADGIHTVSAEEIFRAFIPVTHRERIESLGFQVRPLSTAA